LNIVYDEEIQFTPDVEEAYEQFTKETSLSFAKCSKGGSGRSTGTQQIIPSKEE